MDQNQNKKAVSLTGFHEAVIDVIMLPVAHFLLFLGSLFISAISYLPAQSGRSQITAMIESKLVAGKRGEGS